MFAFLTAPVRAAVRAASRWKRGGARRRATTSPNRPAEGAPPARRDSQPATPYASAGPQTAGPVATVGGRVLGFVRHPSRRGCGRQGTGDPVTSAGTFVTLRRSRPMHPTDTNPPPHDWLYRCDVCRRETAATAADVGRALVRGWPTCCGKGMTLSPQGVHRPEGDE
jgi:hypothetical protein